MPEKIGIKPRYDQKAFKQDERLNKWQTVVSPMTNDDPGVKINQQAWFSLVDLEQDKELDYTLKKENNGVYFFSLDGELNIADENISTKDALAIENASKVSLKAKSKSKVLAIEVPLA